ncbi:MAG: protein kinase domain-containing protein [Candidatus Acidiferrales bacterium]
MSGAKHPVLSVKSTIGVYEVGAAIGAGGMGEVYRARDRKLCREVALKVLPQAFAADPERMGRFEREAKVLASLNHPNIAAIYGFEESGSTRALVMELVEGPTLADRIAKGPIPVDEALPIARQIADALEYAHEHGIVHRDLKPANIKVTSDDAVKVLDFGLAKALEGDAAAVDISSSPTLTRMATQAGIILGTAAFMSPEQAKGKNVDRRTDIWAFGCVFFEMLTAKPAFAGETVTDVLAAVVRAEPDWSQLPSSTPAHIRVLLRRCLQKDPRQRLRDIGDARISLEEVLSGAQESFTSAGVSFPFLRRALPWAVSGVLVGALICGLVFWKLFAPASAQLVHFSAVTNFPGVQAQPAISPDGRSVTFVSNRDGSYNIYVGLLGGGNLVQVTRDPNFKSRPAWSPDGTTIAYGQLNSFGIWDIWEVPALGGTPRRVIQNAEDPAWSPDGTGLAYEHSADGSIWLSGVSGENAHQVALPEKTGWRDKNPRFSPDGRQIAYTIDSNGPYSELDVVDLSSRKIRELTNDGALALSPVWTPDGRFIYFASSRGGTMNVWKLSTTGGSPQQVTAGQGDDAQLDLSADGKKLVFSTWRMNANIDQIDLGAKPGQQTAKLLTTDLARNQVAPSYSPDGTHLAYFSNLKGAERESIWIANADGSSPVQVVRDDRIDIFPSWAPDSQHVIYESGPEIVAPDEYRSVPVSGGTPETVMTHATDRYFDVGLDGRILFRGGEHKVEAFDPRTQKTETLGLLLRAVDWAPVRWSPDEHSVAYVVASAHEDDPGAGLWVTDFKNKPRQLFRGWVDGWLDRGPAGQVYFVEAKPDLKGQLCKVGWKGEGLACTSVTLPMIHSYWVDPVQNTQDHFDVSPDGRHVAFEEQNVLESNIGMLQNIR